MSDQQQTTAAEPANGGGAERQQSVEELEVKARHRQEIAKIEAETETELARLDAERTRRMPVALRMFFDERLYERATMIAERMASAQGFTPQHLIGQPGACFAVVSKALAWNLDPFSVAQSTYQVGGRVAYEGRLVQAVMEASGRLKGGIHARYIGDWSKVEGKFKIEGNKPIRTWSEADEDGLGIVLRAHLHGEDEPREFTFYLKQCHPRNASTWPTRPKQQLHYNAIRAFASIAAPSLLLGVPFHDDGLEDAAPPMRDITPPPAPPPVDLEAEGIKGGGHTTTTGRDPQQPDGAQPAGGQQVAADQGQQASADPGDGETVDPETGEVTEAKPKRQRRSYRQIADDVIAMLADAEDEGDIDAIIDDDVTGGVRANTELMREINVAAQDARQRFAEQNPERSAAPQDDQQQAAVDGPSAGQQQARGGGAELDLGNPFGDAA